jgi:thiol-disulfide isomerase/thioredoxin
MDRLPAVARVLALGCGLTLWVACDGDSGASANPAGSASRFVAVAKQDDGRTPEAFCDVYAPGPAARPFAAPALADGGKLPGAGWRWINVWATWCKPCVEEMPLLSEWKERLARDGAQVDLVFLSVDDTAEAVSEFRRAHPHIPETLRIAQLDDLPSLVTGLGLDEATAIPIQAFVAPDQKLRCVRAGAVGPDDYSAVRALLR